MANAPGADPNALGAVTAIAKPKIKVIRGTRVFDAVSGELLDDPQIGYIEESEKELKVRTDPFARELLTIAKDNIDAHQPSRISEMPQGLINTLTKEEILDLVAYMRSGGNAADQAFAPAGK